MPQSRRFDVVSPGIYAYVSFGVSSWKFYPQYLLAPPSQRVASEPGKYSPRKSPPTSPVMMPRNRPSEQSAERGQASGTANTLGLDPVLIWLARASVGDRNRGSEEVQELVNLTTGIRSLSASENIIPT